MDNKKFGKFVKELRESKNMTQKELGEKLSVTDKAVSKWERGLSFPDIDVLNILAKTFEITVQELLNGEIESKNKIENIQEKQTSDKNKYKKLILFIVIFLIIIIVCIGTVIYRIQLKQNAENQKETKIVVENEYVKIPDRIIYKNSKNQFFVIKPNEKEFNTIYAEIANRIDYVIDGKVLEVQEINKIKKNERFIEFDYNTKSKNRIFPLDEKNIAMISMQTENGQVSKVNISDKEELIDKVERLTKGGEIYELNDYKSYNSSSTLTTIPTDLNYTEKVYEDIYQLVIDNEELYKNAINSTSFTTIKDMPQVDFDKENVIITISKYDIFSIEQNIGNIKYTFAIKNEKYKVNMLVVSKLVNLNCIYCNVNYSRGYYESENDYEINITLEDMKNKWYGGYILKIGDTEIYFENEDKTKKYILKLSDKCNFINGRTAEKMNLDEINVGDFISSDINKENIIIARNITGEQLKEELLKNFALENNTISMINTPSINNIEVIDSDKAIVTMEFSDLYFKTDESFIIDIIVNSNTKILSKSGLSNSIDTLYIGMNDIITIYLDKNTLNDEYPVARLFESSDN